MGEINLLAVPLGAAAFFVVGAVWYSALFLIDAGHFIVGMAAMGGVFLLLR